MSTESISRRHFIATTPFTIPAFAQRSRRSTFYHLEFERTPVLQTIETCASLLRTGPVLSVEWTPPGPTADVPLFSGSVEISSAEEIVRQIISIDRELLWSHQRDEPILKIQSADLGQRYHDLLSLPVAPRYFSGKGWNSTLVGDYVKSCSELDAWIEELHRGERRFAGVADPVPSSSRSGLWGPSSRIIPDYNIELNGKTLRDQLDEIALYTVSRAKQDTDPLAGDRPVGWIVAIAPPFRDDKLRQSEVIVDAFPGGGFPRRYFQTRNRRSKYL